MKRTAMILVLLLAARVAVADTFSDFPSPSPTPSGQPWLSVSPTGNILMSWVDRVDDATHRLRFARLAGDTWKTSVTVATGNDWFVNWADVPSVVEGTGGVLAAHWLQKTAPDTYAYAVRLSVSHDDGNTWSTPVTPHIAPPGAAAYTAQSDDHTDHDTHAGHGEHTGDAEHTNKDGADHGGHDSHGGEEMDHSTHTHVTPGYDGAFNVEHGFVSMIPSGAGVQMVWLDGWRYAHADFPEETALMVGGVDAGGTPMLPWEIDGRVCDCCPTAIVRCSAGAVVAYRDRSGAEVRDIVVTRQMENGWGITWRSGDAWKINGCPVNGPALDAVGERVALAWFTMKGDAGNVNLVTSSDGGQTFVDRVRVDGGAPSGRADVVALEDGGAVVCWIENVGDAAELRVRHVAAGAAVGPVIVVSAISPKRSSGIPRMVRDGPRLLVAWTEVDASSTRVRVRVATLADVMAR